MLSVRINETTVHFEPLLFVGLIIVIVFVFSAVQAIILRQKCRTLSKIIMLGQYDRVIKDGEKILKIYVKYNKRRSSRYFIDWIEYLNLMLAISFFSTSNFTKFFEHMNAVSAHDDIKNFWLSLYYIQSDDLKTAHIYFQNITCSDETQTSRIFLESIVAYKQEDCEEAKKKMTSIYRKLQHPVLRQLADNILI